MIQSKTMRNMPSPMAIQSLMFEGSLLPMDKALRVETKYMTQVARSAPSRAMIRTLFVNKEKADKLEFRPQGIAKFDSKKMGMIGGGMMGAAIAKHYQRTNPRNNVVRGSPEAVCHFFGVLLVL